MKSLLKHLFFSLLPAPPLSTDRASILMYHSVGNHSNYFSSISANHFARQMAYLSERRYEVVSLAELVHRLHTKKPLGGVVAITFDDGYRDNYTIAYPILKRYGFPATIFITTGSIGKTDKNGLEHCTEIELKTMRDSNLIAIEPHTVTHAKLPLLSVLDAAREINESSATTTAISGTSKLFAYPYGAHTDATVRLVKEAGFDGAVTVLSGTVGPSTDPFRLPRNSVDRSTTFMEFRGKISPAIDWYNKFRRVVSLESDTL